MNRAAVKYAAFAAIALLAAVVTVLLYRGASPFVQQLDLRLKDARVRVRGEERTRAPVAIVTVPLPTPMPHDPPTSNRPPASAS